MTDPEIDAALDAIVDAAPPLDTETRIRLAQLLRDRGTSGGRGKAA